MSVFRKPTHTDKYLDFTSHFPLAHKVSLIRTLYRCAKALLSNSLQCTDEEFHVSRALGQNGYSRRLICKTALHTCQATTQMTPVSRHPVATITLPYIQGLSVPIRKVLDSLSILVRFRPHQTLYQLCWAVKEVFNCTTVGASVGSVQR